MQLRNVLIILVLMTLSTHTNNISERELGNQIIQTAVCVRQRCNASLGIAACGRSHSPLAYEFPMMNKIQMLCFDINLKHFPNHCIRTRGPFRLIAYPNFIYLITTPIYLTINEQHSFLIVHDGPKTHLVVLGWWHRQRSGCGYRSHKLVDHL